MHSLKKLLGLIVLYAVIIVGIFVLQFRSDSIIRKNIHGMRVTLAETEGGQGKTVLKDSFHIAFNGISFSGDEKSPVTYTQNNVEFPAKFVSFEEEGDYGCALNFENGLKLLFSLNNDSDKANLWINAEFPENVDSVKIKYSPQSGYSLGEQKGRSIVFNGKSKNFSLTAPELKQNFLVLQKDYTSAYYAQTTEQGNFSLDDVEGLALASKDIYTQTLKSLPQAIISEFLNQTETNANFAASVNEQTVISFLAAMAEAGRYNEGIEKVPDSFINGTRRTYLSSPFLGKMAETISTLTMQIENINTMMERAVQEQTLDVFTMDNIAQYMYANANRSNVIELAKMPASLTSFEPTIIQASGLIRTYIYFEEKNSPLAESLEPVLELCAKKIVDSARLDGEKILIAENETPLSVLAAVIAGDALISYGTLSEQEQLEKLGYLAVNSYSANTQMLDLRTLAELYPVLVHNNTYYPHFELLRPLERENIWAYTIAPSVTYSRDENLTVSLNIEFPVGLSHFMFVSGITPFRRIQIYNMDFRTDARFETYNSSGYVYRNNVQTLLLKSRHRERHEIMRLFYRDIVEEYEEPETEEPDEL